MIRILISSQGALLLWASIAVLAMSVSPCSALEDSDIVIVSMEIPAFVHVDVVFDDLTMNPVTPEEFYNPDTTKHFIGSLINVVSNVACLLRTREDAVLTHSSSSPTIPINASVEVFAANTAERVWDGGWWWVIPFGAGIHNGSAYLRVDVEQEWTVEHKSGLYTGSITVDVIEGTL